MTRDQKIEALSKAEKKKWRFRDSHDYTEELEKDLMELQPLRDERDKLQSRLEKCEGLLRKLIEDIETPAKVSPIVHYIPDRIANPEWKTFNEARKYFAEVEK